MADAGCPVCAQPTLYERGKLPDSLDELSGLVASQAHPGVYWGHNDQGNRTELVAFTIEGKRLSSHALQTTCVDCEDIGLAACAGGPCLVLADTGDNQSSRSEVALLRVAEPDPYLPDPPALPVEHLPFTYPDGAHDAEAIIVDRDGSRAWVVLKQPEREKAAAVFAVGPWPAGGPAVVARFVGDVHLPSNAGAISGASLHPCAPIVLLRASSAVWKLQSADGVLETAFAAPAVSLPAAKEANAEAIAWRADGAGYVTAGEGKAVRITEAVCR